MLASITIRPDDQIYKKLNEKLTDEEDQKIETLYKKMDEFTKKVFQEEYDNTIRRYTVVMGYKKGLGYYTITDADRGYLGLDVLTNDDDKAFYLNVSDLLFENANKLELENREEVKREFNKEFGYLDNGTEEFENFSYIHFVKQYELDALNKYYDGNIPDKFIEYILWHMNTMWFAEAADIVWEYDNETKKLVAKKKGKTKKIGVKNE